MPRNDRRWRTSSFALACLTVLTLSLFSVVAPASPTAERGAEVIERSTSTTVQFTPAAEFLVATVTSSDKSKTTQTVSTHAQLLDHYISKAQGFVSISAQNSVGPIVISHPEGVQHAVRVLVDGVPTLAAFYKQPVPIMTSTGAATMKGTTNVYAIGPLDALKTGTITLEYDLVVSPGTSVSVTFAGTLN